MRSTTLGRFPSPPGACAALALAALLQAAQPCQAADKVLLFQKIKFDSGKWVAVGDGPFKTAYPAGVAPDDPQLAGADLVAGMFTTRKFGSIGADKGGPFRNKTKESVDGLEITIINGVDKFDKTNTKDGDDFDITFNPAGTVMTLKAKAGKELKPNETLWMKIPDARQPGDTADPRPVTYEGKLLKTPPPPPPKPAREKPAAPAAKTTGGSSMSYDATTGSLDFLPGSIGSIQYADGSTTQQNNSTESLIGASITMGSTTFRGPSSDVPGAYSFAETGVVLRKDQDRVLIGTLTDVLLIPDSSQEGADSVLQATLVWKESLRGVPSRYLDEDDSLGSRTTVFFYTDLLAATSNLAASGSASGTFSISNTVAHTSAFVANLNSANVTVIDAVTQTVATTIPDVSGPTGVAVTPNGQTAYVTHYIGATVSVIDVNSAAVTATIGGLPGPTKVAFTPDSARAYVTNYYGGSVSVIDVATSAVTATVSGLPGPWGLTLSPDGTRAYVACYNSNTVVTIDTATNTVIASVQVTSAEAIVVTPDGGTLYTGQQGSNVLTVVDTASNSVVATISGVGAGDGIAITPDGSRLYVSGEGGPDQVSVIDTGTNTIIATVLVDGGEGIAVHPDGSRVYLAGEGIGKVTILDTATNAVLGTIPTGSSPIAVAFTPLLP